jgi:hypothetical protein
VPCRVSGPNSTPQARLAQGRVAAECQHAQLGRCNMAQHAAANHSRLKDPKIPVSSESLSPRAPRLRARRPSTIAPQWGGPGLGRCARRGLGPPSRPRLPAPGRRSACGPSSGGLAAWSESLARRNGPGRRPRASSLRADPERGPPESHSSGPSCAAPGCRLGLFSVPAAPPGTLMCP